MPMRKTLCFAVSLICTGLLLSACNHDNTPPPPANSGQTSAPPAAPPPATPVSAQAIMMELKCGPVMIKLRSDLAPKHVERVTKLTSEGFYNGIVFHRVIEGFMAQTGDPTGTGTGGSNYPDVPAEFSSLPFTRGVVGMARAQSNDSANSQFFIMFADGRFLDGKYTAFGEVTAGMSCVDQLNRGEPPASPDKIIKMQVVNASQ